MCWDSVAVCSVMSGGHRVRVALGRKIGELDFPSDLRGSAWLDLVQASGGEVAWRTLRRLLALLRNVRSLALRDLPLRGVPALVHAGRDGPDPTLALLVHVLSACPRLESLSLLRCACALSPGAPERPEDGLPPSFPRLRALRVSQMEAPEAGSAGWLLDRLPHLRALDLSGSDARLASLLVLPSSLRSLNLVGCLGVGEARVRELVRSPHHSSLRHLSLPSGTPLALALEACAALPALRSLSCCGAFSDSGGALILVEHAELKTLSLCALLLNHSCCFELACPKLESLELPQDAFVSDGLCGLRLRHTPLLERLDVRFNVRLALLPTAPMPRLRSAQLDGCAALSAPMLRDLVQSAPRLEELEMAHCEGLRTEPAVFSLAFAYALRSTPALRYTLPSGVMGVGLVVPSSSLDHDFP